MLNRWIGIVVTLGMLAANAGLVLHDFVPDWLAGHPPETDGLRLEDGQRFSTQIGIFDESGRRIGDSWTIASRLGAVLNVHGSTTLTLRLPGEEPRRLRIDSDLTYQSEQYVDDIKFDVRGLGVEVSIKGEFIPPDDFPCEWRIGEERGRFVLPAAATRALGDVIKPFNRLPGLYVGRSWRLQLVDPLKQLLPNWQLSDLSVEATLVRVVAEETIEHRGQSVSAFRLEAPRLKAWVDASGTVLRQEVEVPLFGRLVLVDEPFNEKYWKELARARVD